MSNKIRKTVEPEFHLSNSWLETKLTYARLECGHLAFVARDIHTKDIPSEMPCPVCGDVDAHRARLLEWKSNNQIAYTRAKYNHLGNYYTVDVYGYNKESPTGVLLLGAVPDIPELQDILTGVLTPLSPTELRN